MILLDTTVLVYAVGTLHPLREPCRALIRAAGDGALRAHTTAEVLQEFTHVRARRRGRADAVILTQHYLDVLRPLIAVEEADVLAGLEVFRATDRLGAFDAVLAAAAIRLGATLVSADRAFDDVAALTYRNPADPDPMAGSR